MSTRQSYADFDLKIKEPSVPVLIEPHEYSTEDRHELLLKELELFSEYYSFILHEPELVGRLNSFAEKAVQHCKTPSRINEPEDAVRQMVKELIGVDAILKKHHYDKNALIQIMLDIQGHNNWLPKCAIMWTAERLDVPLARIYHIATFYKSFSLTAHGSHLVQVCCGTACHVRGSQRLLENVAKVLKIEPGQTDDDLRFTFSTVNCLGCCALGPVVAVDKDYYSNPSVEELEQIFDLYK